ncbi:Uma2 family endonuclease [Aphanothece sacrum]|uniref:Restriction endonuclease n=1 Tax=Aphanothece sacrum FPU1 TaxID=1920663 RepID=A0A401IGK3_APHSA|nr:Uma2 family endonuclease [Aphanothece sacrum]GBF80344.1 restriction endonuclease [Aphanothece sacrum FPU1]GBF83751.1 restriction endonuclease family protein [Aphanothece sacrum FPU3]
MPNLTVKDLEKLQAEHPDYRMELVEGDVIFMSPSGLESEEIGIEIAAQLRNWVRPRRLGRVSGSSGGFRLPNEDGDVRAPDVSFIIAQRLPHTTEDYAELVPDLMFEVKSKTDSLTKLREKIQQFLELGTTVGVLVDPRTRTMEVYRLNADKIVLKDGDVLEVPEILAGWELPVVEVWAPEFE